MRQVWTPWRAVQRWGLGSQAAALVNARVAATETSRLRVEREAVELFLAERRRAREAGSRPA
jgi:hypothetical protein